MYTIPTPQRTANQKVEGIFYPLQPEELIALRQAKLINNAAYVHLALRLENPFCDRPVEVVPKEFAHRWLIPESSVYEALSRLKQLGVLSIELGKAVIRWIRSHTVRDFDPPEASMSSQNQLQNSGILSEPSEKQQLEPSPSKVSSSSQTNQTLKTNQTENDAVQKSEVKKDFSREERQRLESSSDKSGLSLTSLSSSLTRLNYSDQKLPPRQDNDSKIPADLENKLEELKIPLDRHVQKQITTHALSQSYGAVAHIERTWETINNPRGVFLFQLSRQPKEALGTREPVRRASEHRGYTLEHLKKMYPSNWREAAAHFKITIPSTSTCFRQSICSEPLESGRNLAPPISHSYRF